MEKESKFSPSVAEWLSEGGWDIEKMSLEELKEFRKTVQEQIDKDTLLDLSVKLLGNGAYGASSHPSFYFYNINLASDITAECRETTRFMETEFEKFFHGEWWDRTDVHQKFGIELDPAKKEWYDTRSMTVYGDTDSVLSGAKLLTSNGIMTIEDFFNRNAEQHGIEVLTPKGHEWTSTGEKVLDWTADRGLYYGKVKRIVRHRVSKPKWTLKTKSGKEITVTGDHSMVVFRDGKQLVVKPSEILMTDKILCIND